MSTTSTFGASFATSTELISSQTIAALSPGLLSFALRSIKRREDAEDLLQEMWISALRSAATFDGRSSLRTWLTSILRRRMADFYRRERHVATLDEEAHESPWRPLTEQYEHEQAVTLAARAMAELSGLERTAITLCDVQDLDREEAALHMQIERGYLRVLLHRGRGKLELALRDQGIDRACA
jgi:RNA polymerase sigma-70 factor (ECF subfamily)